MSTSHRFVKHIGERLFAVHVLEWTTEMHYTTHVGANAHLTSGNNMDIVNHIEVLILKKKKQSVCEDNI